MAAWRQQNVRGGCAFAYECARHCFGHLLRSWWDCGQPCTCSVLNPQATEITDPGFGQRSGQAASEEGDRSVNGQDTVDVQSEPPST